MSVMTDEAGPEGGSTSLPLLNPMGLAAQTDIDVSQKVELVGAKIAKA